MGGKQKWTIADEVLKESFRTLGIDVLYFPLFKKNAIERLNDIADSYEPEQDDINSSIELAGEWVKIYAEQIKLGLSKLWVSTYADYRVSWPKDDSANEAYNNVCKNFGEEKADKDLAIFTKSLCDDPVFVKSYIDFFHDGFMDAENRAHEYTNLYKSLIEKGKSGVYARQYALHYLDVISPDYCELYASKYEECINKGRDDDKARRIATAFENLYEEYWPDDDNLLGIEAHNSYMKGFEYAIENDIDSPETFAEEYEKAYLHSLFPDEEEPPCKIKGKYNDIISKLLASKLI
jgi:hypothetical protein